MVAAGEAVEVRWLVVAWVDEVVSVSVVVVPVAVEVVVGVVVVVAGRVRLQTHSLPSSWLARQVRLQGRLHPRCPRAPVVLPHCQQIVRCGSRT